MDNLVRLILLAICISLFVCGTGALEQANATTYYVDFNNGSDANNGLTQGTAWLNIPGTQNAANTGVVAGATGWHSISAGDEIYVKSGTTHDSTKGGRIVIDSAYYGNGTSNSPIAIKRKLDWGTGQTVINGTGITVPTWLGLITVYRAYITLDGSEADGILVENSSYYNIEGYWSAAADATVGWVFKNLQLYNSKSAGLITQNSGGERSGYRISDVTVDTVTCDLTNGSSDGDDCISIWYAHNVTIKNSTASRACNGTPNSCDGFHLGNVYDAVIDNCISHDNWEQGFDISKGDKTKDDTYNVLIRNSFGYNNYKMNFDTNSSCRDIYFVNNTSWNTSETASGDGGFTVYSGGNRVFFINDTTAGTHDMGFLFAWWDWYGILNAGSYNQYVINSISSGDGGNSVNVEPDYSSRGFNVAYYNSIFNSVNGTAAVNSKGTTYVKANINANSGGWAGKSCQAVDPIFTSLGSSWATTNLYPQSSSPTINAGVFPFTTSASGSGTTLILTPLVADLDARYAFRVGDTIQIQDAGTATIAAIPSTTQITLTTSQTWVSGKGVWYPWPNQKLNIGAMPVGNISLPAPPPVPQPVSVPAPKLLSPR